jgi:hypothetical protein
MKRRYHIPTRVKWNTEPNAEESARLQGMAIAAIRRAVESLAGDAAEIVVSSSMLTSSSHFLPSL